MNKIARKLVLSALTVVLTVVALGTSTFAWFTVTNTAVIQSFEAEIVADSGIEIALSDGADPLLYNWKTTITTADVNAYIAAKYPSGFLFNNLTSPLGRVFYDATGASSTTGVLVLNIHFRSADALAINWTGVSLTSGTVPWTSGVSFTNEHGTAITAGSNFDVNAADAMRISVTGIIASTTTTTVYENPASTTNVVLGELSAVDLTGADGSVNYYTTVNSLPPFGVGSVTVAPTVTSIVSTKILDTVGGSLATAGAEYYGAATIRVWFEGWDANSYNSLLAKIITANFQFKS